ncbi:uncharacterized protein LOC111260861 isoform X2 [Varroa jacobsoni]|uniref:uncharacterized protein LOC111260861 isoform X2 n=1 Tax=Varroa jacobsoni TaxID=62625 RepID=UPI000BF5472E|nr:uncharacterized protein LOC111260861 isoform X2 [Varroa jacobsoni]
MRDPLRIAFGHRIISIEGASVRCLETATGHPSRVPCAFFRANKEGEATKILRESNDASGGRTGVRERVEQLMKLEQGPLCIESSMLLSQ